VIIDLSRAIENDVPADPPGFGPVVSYTNHKSGAQELIAMFPGLRAEDLPDGEGWAIERLSVSTHNGTHVDALWHYASSDGGKRAMTIDELPLDWFLRPGVKLDFRHMDSGRVVTARELEEACRTIDYELKPFDIVLMNTSAGGAHGTDSYLGSGCGFGREATLWLLNRGIKVVGTDAWSWDAPFLHTRKRFAAERDPSIIWEGHKAGREGAYFQIEKLANLEVLPAIGFTVACFPVKIKAASAGFSRVVAILEETLPTE
jgi:kynurenine formamidase